jgi:hypothetical protein
MVDQRIRLISDADEAKTLGVNVGDQVREYVWPQTAFEAPTELPPEVYGVHDASLGELVLLQPPLEFSDRELDAATLAYVAVRYSGAEAWRTSFPEAWRETRKRIHAALIAAAAVRPSA